MSAPVKGKIAAVDIGTAKICATCGEVPDGGGLVLRGVGTGLSRGWRGYAIVQPEEITAGLARAVSRAARMAATTISQAVLSLSGPFYDFPTTSCLVQISPASGKITEADLEAAERLAKDRTADPQKITLHILPQRYLIGPEVAWQKPLDQPAKTLQVDYLVIRCDRDILEQILNISKKAGLEIIGLVFPPLADYEVMLANRVPAGGCVLLNIGGLVTEAMLWQNGRPQAAAVVKSGSGHLNYDIAYGLQISPPEAERLKILYGGAWPEDVAADDQIDVLIQENTKTRFRKIYRRFLSEIIRSRLSDTLDEVKQKLALPDAGRWPVVLAGGGSLLKGTSQLVRHLFGGEVITDIPEVESDIVDSPVYTTSVGLLLYGLRNRLYPVAEAGAGTLLLEGFGWLKKRLRRLF